MERPTSSRSCRQRRPQRATSASREHAVRVVAERRAPPDLDRLVAALLALAMANLNAERRAEADDGERDGDPAGATAAIEQSSRLR